MVSIKADLSSWKNVENWLLKHKEKAPELTDETVIQIGTLGRKGTQNAYGSLEMGNITEHGDHTGGTVWDSARGYISRNEGAKMSYFTWEKVARRKRTPISETILTDKLWNLFENGATWTNASPLFRTGGEGKFGRMKAGSHRNGMRLMSKAIPIYKSNLDTAVNNAWDKIMGGIK